MDKEAWSFACWKQFHNKLYQEALTPSDVLNGGAHDFYEYTYRIMDGRTAQYSVEPEEYRKCIRISKGSKKYLLPTKWENDMPLKPKTTFECQLRPSDKSIWQFITSPTKPAFRVKKMM